MKDKIAWRGGEYMLEWFDDTDFSKLDNITQVCGFLFDSGGRLAVVAEDIEDGWHLPGGTPETYDSSFENVLIREVDEEIDAEVDRGSLMPLGYVKVTPLQDDEKGVHYCLRFVGVITKINEQTVDVATGKINHRKFVKPDDFLGYCKWGRIGRIQRDRAVKLWRMDMQDIDKKSRQD